MADRLVIYDPNLQLGTVVDSDDMLSLGPVGAGPNAAQELQQFINHMPEVIWDMSSYELRTAYLQFWEANFSSLYEQPQPDSQPAVVESNGAGGDAEALAEAEASTAADAPPPPQPADTDTEAQAEAPPYVGVCFACQGKGTQPGLEPGSVVSCNLCQGTGKLPVEAAATRPGGTAGSVGATTDTPKTHSPKTEVRTLS